MLSPDELGLFREQIHLMDKKIQPGLTKLTWSSKAANVFIRECLLHVSKVVTQSSPFSNMGMCTGKKVGKSSVWVFWGIKSFE